MKSLTAVIGLIALVLVAWNGLAVVVNEGQMAVILEFGRPVRAITEPGLSFKQPFVQSITYLDKRVQIYDAKPEDIITRDKKTMHVDNYAVWRISDPLKFLTTVGTPLGAQTRLDDVVYSELRAALGQHDFIDVVGKSRETVHQQVTLRSDAVSRLSYGVEILDVRIRRADLPKENQDAVFARMKSERQRQATQYRSEGAEEAAKIKAQSDKDKAIILAEANQKAEVLRGQGEAEAIQVYNAALGQDPEFYAFIRSLETYKKTLGNGRTRLILSPDSPLFKYLLGGR